VSDRPDDVDAAFAEIVADLQREGVGRTLPDLDDPPDTTELPVMGDPTAARDKPPPNVPPTPPPVRPTSLSPGHTVDTPRNPEPPQPWRGHNTDWDWSWGTDEEHYVPPEPPPLPRLRPLTIASLVLIVLGVVLLIIPSLIGLDARIATPIALLAVTFGGGMLLLRARQTPKDPTTRDDGAQI
jgi:hypothetical protein